MTHTYIYIYLSIYLYLFTEINVYPRPRRAADHSTPRQGSPFQQGGGGHIYLTIYLDLYIHIKTSIYTFRTTFQAGGGRSHTHTHTCLSIYLTYISISMYSQRNQYTPSEPPFKQGGGEATRARTHTHI